MGSIIVIISSIITIVLLKLIFGVNLKKTKELLKDKELEKISNKFPNNTQMAKEMLSLLDNKNVKIETTENSNTSLYIVAANKILVANDNNYSRIQTIAHECLHSIQSKKILFFNFIFSNLIIIYYVTVMILTILNVLQNTMLQIFILTLLSLIKIATRGYLEMDAMIKARYLAEEYIQSKGIIGNEETSELLNKYEEINKIGIPSTIFFIVLNSVSWIVIYSIIAICI